MTVIDRANRDRAEGRLWKARDRLNGALAARSYDPECLDLLGDVLWEMGDRPAAGAAWYLTVRDDERAQQARSDFEAQWGHRPEKLLAELVIKLDVADYPLPVRDRLLPLIVGAQSNHFKWVPASQRGRRAAELEQKPSRWEGFWIVFGIAVFLIGFVLAVEAAHWLFKEFVDLW